MYDQLFMFAAIGFLIVMMVMNSRKRKKQQSELNTALKAGAWVMLSNGIVGEIVELTDDRVTIESTPGTKLLVVKAAVARIVDAPEKPKAVAKAAAKPAVKKPASPAVPAVKKPAAKKPAAKN